MTQVSWQQELIDDTEQDVLQWLVDQPDASAKQFAEYVSEHLDNIALMCEEDGLLAAIDECRLQLVEESAPLMQSEFLTAQFAQFKTALLDLDGNDEEMVANLDTLDEGISVLQEEWIRVFGTDDWATDVQPLLAAFEYWAEEHEAKALVRISQWLVDNLGRFDESLFSEHRQELLDFGETLFHLACQPEDDNTCFELLEIAEANFWPSPLSEADSLAIFALFIPGSETAEEEEHEWSAADVSLTFADDVSPQVMECFLQDSPQQLEELSRTVTQLHTCFDVDSVHLAQRLSHTIKGAANLVGVKAVANLSHQMEALLEIAATENLPFTPPQLEWLQVSVDCLADSIDSLTGQADAPSTEQLLQQLFPPEAGAEIIAVDLAEQAISTEQQAPIENPASAEKQVPKIAAVDTGQEKIPVEKKDYDQLISLAEEMSITLVQTRDLQTRLRSLLVGSLRQDDNLQARRFDLESLVDSRSQAGGLAQLHVGSPSDMDPLEMDRYDELHGCTHRFIETVMDSRAYTRQLNEEFIQLDSLIQEQQRHNVGLQSCLLGARQVPVSYISQRLQRCVRETCRATGKNAQLVILGENLRVDKEMLDALAWALMHLVRNAIDHGIESPDRRLAMGKPEQGVVTLSFATDGLKLKVNCVDDGAGLDLQRITEKAVARGIVTADSKALDAAQIESIVFQSGFSTRDSASQISGRGIGLDAVRDRLASMGGEIRLQNISAKNCVFNLELPLKRLTQHLLLVRCGERRYAVPTNTLQQTLPSDTGELRMIAGKPFLEWQSVLYPYYELQSILAGAATQITLGKNSKPTMLVQLQQGLAAVGVDQLLGAQSLVRRPLGDYVGNLRGVDGITLMGDGTPVALLEPRSLLAKAEPRLGVATKTVLEDTNTRTIRVLVVDDSLSVRNALSELLTDMGFDVITAIDGMDAVDQVQEHSPDLVLVDMEMPRMNGLDFTRWVRRESAEPDLPVVMITSRTQGKHRKMAEDAGVNHYQTKPYSDIELLDCINGLLLREVS